MNTPTWMERLVGSLEDKKQYREYRARVKALPGDYRAAAQALERYLTHVGPTSDGAVLLALLTDLVDTLERGAARGEPVRAVVGDDPVELADALLRRHPGGSWVDGWVGTERARLAAAVRAAGTGGAR